MSEQQNNQTAALGTAPVGPLLFRLALPTITAQVVNLLYSIVDRIYIGRIPLEGKLALTGMGVTFPVITLISAFAALIGMGGAPRASIALGAKEHDRAERILGTCTAALWALALVLTALFLLFQAPYETVRRICRHPAVCDAVPQPLRSRHGFRDDIARSERLHHRAGPLLGCDENRCHRCGAQHRA